MSLSPRNEWIVVGALIVYIAFVPSFPFVQDILGSSIGKAIGLASVIYVWKMISEPIALLLLVAILRSGAIREYADDASMKPTAPALACNCEAGFEMDEKTMMCKKGNETKASICCQETEEWDVEANRCILKGGDPAPSGPPASLGVGGGISSTPEEVTPPTTSGATPPASSGAGGPPGGTTPSAAAQMSAMADLKEGPKVEKFSPYEKPSNGGFSLL